jgi:hypothetical protein
LDFCDEITTHCQPRVMWSLLAAVAFSELARASNANPATTEKHPTLSRGEWRGQNCGDLNPAGFRPPHACVVTGS